MGCVSCRDAAPQTYVSLDDWKSNNWTALDCTVDSDSAKGAEAHANKRLPNSYYFDMNKFNTADAKIEVKDLHALLTANGLGADSRLLCYDTHNGVQAAKAATLLRAAGVKDVAVLNDVIDKKAEEKKEKPLEATKKAEAKETDLAKNFKADVNAVFATDDDLKKSQVLDIRPAADFAKGKYVDASANVELAAVYSA